MVDVSINITSLWLRRGDGQEVRKEVIVWVIKDERIFCSWYEYLSLQSIEVTKVSYYI